MFVVGMDVTTEARKYLGTPFHHQGRLLGKGIDCVGLLVCVGRSLGLMDYDNPTYPRQPAEGLLLKELDHCMDSIPVADTEEGDLLVFWFAPRSKLPQHVGFRTDRGLLHTYADVGKVVEHSLTEKWLKRICAAYRFRRIHG